MIREFNLNEINEIDSLLKPFNYNLEKNLKNNIFLKGLVYTDEIIKGVLIYNLIYDRIEIEYIIVHPNYRKQGIATKLLNNLIYNNKNISNITLEVRNSNIPAIKLYENNGFEKVAIRKNYYGSEDGILMIKKVCE